MIQKIVNILLVLSILVLACVLGIRFFSGSKPAVVEKIYRTTPVDEESASRAETALQNFKALLNSEELDDPEVQKALGVFQSPEGKAFFENPPADITEVYAFFESQGLAMDREHFMREFRKVFPTEEPEVLETKMRQRLADMVKDASVNLSTLNDENEADIDLFDSIIMGFLADPENAAWMQGQFQGDYQAFGEWVVDVFQNPTPPPIEDLGTTVTDETPNNVENDFLPERLDPQQESAQVMPTELPNFENGDTRVGSDAGNNAILPEPTELPVFDSELLMDEGFKQTLSESFSPERFNRAMQTLNQYGPKEGMRRLKELDPAVATRIERFVQQPKEDP
jgi:hypothetical protein